MSTQSLNGGASLDDLTKKTIDLLGRIIKKPPLTAKLLSKPPFRYLHDLFSELIKVSGFANGLYSDVEMNHENVKDKEGKVAYLMKMIDCVGIATGVEVRANPLKIVAGLEPEETNAFLQLLAKATLKKVDTTDAVRRVLTGEHQGKTGGAKHHRPYKALIFNKDSGSTSDLRKGKSQQSLDAKGKASSKEQLAQKPKPAAPAAAATPAPKAAAPPKAAPPAAQPPPPASAAPVPVPAPQPPAPAPEKAMTPAEQPQPQPSSAQDDAAVEEESLKIAEPDAEDRPTRLAATVKRRERPASARPPPPKQRAAEVALEEAPRNTPAIITEGEKHEDDDDDFVIVNEPQPDTLPAATPVVGPGADEKHGGLVQKMLQTKKELEGKDSEEVSKEAGTGGSKDKSAAKKEIEALRESIQLLCRSTNPLGKTMDYMQEDVDSMNKELDHWRSENKKYKALLDAAKTDANESIGPLEAQLKQIENAIEEQLDKISITKAAIIQNDALILKLLRNKLAPRALFVRNPTLRSVCLALLLPRRTQLLSNTITSAAQSGKYGTARCCGALKGYSTIPVDDNGEDEIRTVVDGEELTPLGILNYKKLVAVYGTPLPPGELVRLKNCTQCDVTLDWRFNGYIKRPPERGAFQYTFNCRACVKATRDEVTAAFA
ncbi:TRAF3-interacting protein 1 [Borealophlyctis nickersoniae]|nr:TRAF3-interacting protein 1 [Borealophlyctis nickersoniae]